MPGCAPVVAQAGRDPVDAFFHSLPHLPPGQCGRTKQFCIAIRVFQQFPRDLQECPKPGCEAGRHYPSPWLHLCPFSPVICLLVIHRKAPWYTQFPPHNQGSTQKTWHIKFSERKSLSPSQSLSKICLFSQLFTQWVEQVLAQAARGGEDVPSPDAQGKQQLGLMGFNVTSNSRYLWYQGLYQGFYDNFLWLHASADIHKHMDLLPIQNFILRPHISILLPMPSIAHSTYSSISRRTMSNTLQSLFHLHLSTKLVILKNEIRFIWQDLYSINLSGMYCILALILHQLNFKPAPQLFSLSR